MLAAFLLAVAAQTYVRPPSLPRATLDGPVDVCAEDFSVRLEAGETVEWELGYAGSIRYEISNSEIAVDVYRIPAGRLIIPAAAQTTSLSLPLSPVTRRSVFEESAVTKADGRGRPRRIATYGVMYFLHGQAETETPLRLLGDTEDRAARFAFLDRVDPRLLAERQCTLSRDDPALAGRIVHIPGGQ